MEKTPTCEIEKEQAVTMVYILLSSGSPEAALRYCKEIDMSPKDEMLKPMVLAVIEKVFQDNQPYCGRLEYGPDDDIDKQFFVLTETMKLRLGQLPFLIFEFGIDLQQDLTAEMRYEMGMYAPLRGSNHREGYGRDRKRDTAISTSYQNTVYNLLSKAELDIKSDGQRFGFICSTIDDLLKEEKIGQALDLGEKTGLDKTVPTYLKAIEALVDHHRISGDLEKAVAVGEQHELRLRHLSFRNAVFALVQELITARSLDRAFALGMKYGLNARHEFFRVVLEHKVEQFEREGNHEEALRVGRIFGLNRDRELMQRVLEGWVETLLERGNVDKLIEVGKTYGVYNTSESLKIRIKQYIQTQREAGKRGKAVDIAWRYGLDISDTDIDVLAHEWMADCQDSREYSYVVNIGQKLGLDLSDEAYKSCFVEWCLNEASRSEHFWTKYVPESIENLEVPKDAPFVQHAAKERIEQHLKSEKWEQALNLSLVFGLVSEIRDELRVRETELSEKISLYLQRGSKEWAKQIIQELGICPRSEIVDLLMGLGAYENFVPIYREIEAANNDVPYEAPPLEILEGLCNQFGRNILDQYEVQGGEQRSQNIALVNEHQQDWLVQNGNDTEIPDKQKRRLVLYYRGSQILGGQQQQMDPFEFLVATWAVQKYISEGRSSLYNEVAIVSRAPGDYPKEIHSLCPGVEYLDVGGDAFKRACSVGANTIHFTHGTSIENQFGSVPIIGLPIQLDSHRIGQVDTYVPLQLDYFKNNSEAQRDRTPDNPSDHSGSIPGIIQEVLRAVHESEMQEIQGEQWIKEAA